MGRRPASTPEARENQLIDLAVNLAEKQLTEGTASAMVITHYLRMSSPKEKLEREKLVAENQHLRAKVEALESGKQFEEMYTKAMDAFRVYHGDDPYESQDIQ